MYLGLTMADQKRSVGKTIRDYVIYLAISISFLLCMLYLATSGMPQSELNCWLLYSLWTPFVFGFFIEKHREYWRRSSFWVWITSCLLAHTFLFLILARNTGFIDTHYVVPSVVVEYAFLLLYRDLMRRLARR